MWLLGAVALPNIGPAGQQGENSNTSLKCISQAHGFTLSIALGALLSVSSGHPHNSWAAGLHQLWHSLFQLSQHQGTAWAQDQPVWRALLAERKAFPSIAFGKQHTLTGGDAQEQPAESRPGATCIHVLRDPTARGQNFSTLCPSRLLVGNQI